MKKLLTVLFSLLLVAVLLPFVLHAASADSETSGKCGDDLTWTFDEETGTLKIEGSGSMWNFWITEAYDGSVRLQPGLQKQQQRQA